MTERSATGDDATSDPDPLGWGAGASDDDPAFALLLQATQHAVQQQVHGVELSAAGEQVFLGRYRVRSLAGKGGMGTVLAAEDEWLERKVALKIVNTPGARQRRRLVREGIALAKLSHPNVVQVHDVELGQRGEQAYVAMEYVEGSTLARWQASEPRPLAEVLDKYLQAARGLWAAHQVGIVHRDFKPHNVLVDGAGVVKVVDFGLASGSDPAAEDGDDDVPRAVDRAITTPQAAAATTSGTGLGLTPGYCAPEQLRGERPTAKADQFGFCAALYEALTGVLPFGSSRVPRAYEQAVAAGIGGRPEAAKIPRRVARVLARGLAPRPGDRFDDMAELVAALEPRPSRWPWVVAVALAPVAAVLTAMLMPAAQVEVEVDPCVLEDDALPLERAPEALALRSEGAAAEAQRFVAERATAYRASWKDASEGLCRTARREGTEGPTQAQACLGAAAREFNLVMKLVTAAGSSTDPYAAFDNLHAPTLCVLGGGRPAYGSTNPELQREFDEVRALQLEGRDDEALPRARALHQRATAVGDTAILAQVSFLMGKLELLTDQVSPARRDLEEASVHAEALGDDILAVDALAELIDVAANLALDPSDGAWWERLGEAKLRRSGAQETEVAGQFHSAVANLAYRRGDVAAALEHGRRAHGLLALHTGEDSLATLMARTNHAVALVKAGRPKDAIAEHEEILAVRRRRYGERHPATLDDELRLSRARMEANEPEQALAGLARVEALAEPGSEDGELLRVYAATRRCEILANRFDFVAARPVCERASSRMPLLSREDRRHVQTMIILYAKQGLLLASEERYEEALEPLARERELLLTQVPPDAEGLAYNTSTRCAMLLALGRVDECALALEQSRQWYETSGRLDELRLVRQEAGLDPAPARE